MPVVSDNFGLLKGRVQRMENLINGVLDSVIEQKIKRGVIQDLDIETLKI
jgi:hypothetical protein